MNVLFVITFVFFMLNDLIEPFTPKAMVGCIVLVIAVDALYSFIGVILGGIRK